HFSDRCDIECKNGGTVVESNCNCKCIYGFDGKNCEQLSRRKFFTDASCGVYEKEHGLISLSTYPRSQTNAIFCQWLIKSQSGKTIEFYVKDLDLDGENMPPNTPCNDFFYIWGAKSILNPISCNKSAEENLIGIRFESDSDWLLIELRTNPWSDQPHRGPQIKYRQIDAPYQRCLFL
ncbi:unnamed protein product, partial [Thelazia callipaeda]|uniref:CUB domain-containing protein n=1 Tax=Thelazia callipaeda TaxID=103827 RepID=A0A0N5CNK3_THECL